jgi:cytochrome oxidase Cu insertion factor (SCO1/SenC/PrrC family)
MENVMKLLRFLLISLSSILLITSCAAGKTQEPPLTVTPAPPEWFGMKLTDARTGETFTLNDYAGKTVLVETMAIWCPNCIVQANQVRKLREALGNPDDLISISLDVDYNEDQAALKDYVAEWGFDWHFAVAPLEVARALGNLYSAEYLNPPLSPMLIIDRNGNVHQLEYGLKDVEKLQKLVEPYLTK